MAGSQITNAKAQAAIRGWVEQQFTELDRSSYYHLLQVAPNAYFEQIKSAYYTLVARLHPDLYVETLDQPTRGKLISIYSRIVEGYRVLSDGGRRQLYDQGLKQGKLRLTVEDERPSRQRTGATLSTGSTMNLIKNEHARRFFKLGQDALRSGNKAAAIQNLNFALSAEPGNELVVALLNEAKRK
jgi:curved DNA-binding protein CbpA